ncbi:MAG: hypothetical protein ACP5O6_05775, partial [Candidatus Baltobacteraceae bacterium]
LALLKHAVGGPYTVDPTGCVLQNGSPAAQAPIIAYVPGSSSTSTPTYAPNAGVCTDVASLGLSYPGNAGAQILIPVLPGSNPGSCTVTIAASPAPSGTPGPGSGLVPVQVAAYSCDFIGGSCTAPPGTSSGSGGCGFGTSGGQTSTTSYKFMLSSPSTGTITTQTSGQEVVTRTGSGTIWLVSTTATTTYSGAVPHCSVRTTLSGTKTVI